MTVFLLQLRIHLTFSGKSYAVLTDTLEVQLKVISQSFSLLNKSASQLRWEKRTTRLAFEQLKQENTEYDRQISQQNHSHEWERKESWQCLWLYAPSKEVQWQQQSCFPNPIFCQWQNQEFFFIRRIKWQWFLCLFPHC